MTIRQTKIREEAFMGKAKYICVIVAGVILKLLRDKEPEPYSEEWIKNLSNEERKKEREKVRKKYSNPEYSDQERIRFSAILRLFDRIQSEIDWNGEKPRGRGYSREHGYNLYKDD